MKRHSELETFDTQAELHTGAIAVHWIVALTILFLLATGLYMASTDSWNLYPIHKSIGVLLFFVALTRAMRRLRAGWPTPVSRYHRIEQSLSKVMHCVLLIGSLAVPVTGMLYSGLSGHGFGVFGLVTLVPTNHSALDPNVVMPYSEYWGLLAQQTHQIVAYVLAGAIALHIAGALKHHLIDRDRTLLRMIGAGKTKIAKRNAAPEGSMLRASERG